MGIPERHANAPYVDGETLFGETELEIDVAALFAQIKNIENINVASGADINGTKIALNSVPVAKLAAETIDGGDKLAANTLLQGKIASGAFSNMQYNRTAGAVAVNALATDVELGTVTITVSADPGKVVLLATAVSQFGFPPYRLFWKKDSADLPQPPNAIEFEMTNTLQNATLMHIGLDGAATAGSRVYRLMADGQVSPSSDNLSVTDIRLTAIELRR